MSHLIGGFLRVGRASKLTNNRHLWVVIITFTAVAVLHYPQQIFGIAQPSILSFVGVTNHLFECMLFLVPIAFASYFFNIKVGLATTATALAIMLPRVFFISQSPPDALLETVVVVLFGVLLNTWFHVWDLKALRQKSVEEMFGKIIDGSPIATFAIDKQHQVTHWNSALELLSGIKKHEIIGTDEQWKAFYSTKRAVLADLITDGASSDKIEMQYPISSGKAS